MSLRPEEGAGTLDERVLIAPDEVLESERSSVITGMVVARAWRDPGYRNRLLSSPREVLIEEGLEIPGGMAIRVFADTPAVRHIHLTSLTTEAEELVPVLREMLPLPEGSEVRLIQNTEQALCLVIPLAPPEPQTLTDVDVLRRLAPRASAFASGDVIATVVSDAFMEAAGEAAAAAAAAAAVNTTQTETATATAFAQESSQVVTTTTAEGFTTSVIDGTSVAVSSADSMTSTQSATSSAADTSVSTQTNAVTLTNTYTTTDVSTTSFEATSNVTTQTTAAETTVTAVETEAAATTTTAVAEGEAAVVVVAVGAAVLT